MVDFVRLGVGLALSGLIGGLGYWRHSLTRSGWLGAILVGTASVGFGGWIWGMLVVVFFVTSSALSHWRRSIKERIAVDKFSKTEQRDLQQTLANGGAVVIFALLNLIQPSSIWLAAALGALATVTADTWATEVGTLSRTPPRLVTNGRTVSAGTSGGITPLGLLATVAGSIMIGAAAFALTLLLERQIAWWLIPAAFIGGVAGSLTDSLLGATVQQMRWCPRCEVETERLIHRCGTPTEHLRGWRWLDNEWVNLFASLVGGAVSVVVWLVRA